MRTVVRFRAVHDHSPEPFILPDKVPANRLAERLQAHFQQVVHSANVKVRITTTGPFAGDVLITHGPFAIQGRLLYESAPAPTTEPGAGAS